MPNRSLIDEENLVNGGNGQVRQTQQGKALHRHRACCALAFHSPLHRITESQNHRITDSQNGRGWKGPLWSPSSTPLPKQGHPEQAAQDHVQAGLEYLRRRRLHSLPGQPGPGLRHPQREEVLPRVQLELPLLQFVPIAPCPVAGHHWKELPG